ncbi:MAG: N-acetylmuramic acid 6-phosphate etherase [Planctomycetota bacterium]
MNTLEYLQQIHALDRELIERVGAALPDAARAAEAAAERLQNSGRIFYLGAGTSGRLGVLDASELSPTFGIDGNVVIALIAGGRDAMFISKEGAEDDARAAAAELDTYNLSARDVVVGIAASGATPYVIGGIEHARVRGCLTISIVCVRDSLLTKLSDVSIAVDAGPEILSGSTRMKAGTAQKLILNMFSTAVARRLGLIYKGEMVAMRPSNAKLKKRAVRILRDLLQVPEPRAAELLELSGSNLPVALVAGKWNLNVEQARTKLQQKNGNVARALDEN